MRRKIKIISILIIVLLQFSCGSVTQESSPKTPASYLFHVKSMTIAAKNIITITFNRPVNTDSFSSENVTIMTTNGMLIPYTIQKQKNPSIVILNPFPFMLNAQDNFLLTISKKVTDKSKTPLNGGEEDTTQRFRTTTDTGAYAYIISDLNGQIIPSNTISGADLSKVVLYFSASVNFQNIDKGITLKDSDGNNITGFNTTPVANIGSSGWEITKSASGTTIKLALISQKLFKQSEHYTLSISEDAIKTTSGTNYITPSILKFDTSGGLDVVKNSYQTNYNKDNSTGNVTIKYVNSGSTYFPLLNIKFNKPIGLLSGSSIVIKKPDGTAVKTFCYASGNILSVNTDEILDKNEKNYTINIPGSSSNYAIVNPEALTSGGALNNAIKADPTSKLNYYLDHNITVNFSVSVDSSISSETIDDTKDRFVRSVVTDKGIPIVFRVYDDLGDWSIREKIHGTWQDYIKNTDINLDRDSQLFNLHEFASDSGPSSKFIAAPPNDSDSGQANDLADIQKSEKTFTHPFNMKCGIGINDDELFVTYINMHGQITFFEVPIGNISSKNPPISIFTPDIIVPGAQVHNPKICINSNSVYLAYIYDSFDNDPIYQGMPVWYNGGGEVDKSSEKPDHSDGIKMWPLLTKDGLVLRGLNPKSFKEGVWVCKYGKNFNTDTKNTMKLINVGKNNSKSITMPSNDDRFVIENGLNKKTMADNFPSLDEHQSVIYPIHSYTFLNIGNKIYLYYPIQFSWLNGGTNPNETLHHYVCSYHRNDGEDYYHYAKIYLCNDQFVSDIVLRNLSDNTWNTINNPAYIKKKGYGYQIAPVTSNNNYNKDYTNFDLFSKHQYIWPEKNNFNYHLLKNIDIAFCKSSNYLIIDQSSSKTYTNFLNSGMNIILNFVAPFVRNYNDGDVGLKAALTNGDNITKEIFKYNYEYCSNTSSDLDWINIAGFANLPKDNIPVEGYPYILRDMTRKKIIGITKLSNGSGSYYITPDDTTKPPYELNRLDVKSSNKSDTIFLLYRIKGDPTLYLKKLNMTNLKPGQVPSTNLVAIPLNSFSKENTIDGYSNDVSISNETQYGYIFVTYPNNNSEVIEKIKVS